MCFFSLARASHLCGALPWRLHKRTFLFGLLQFLLAHARELTAYQSAEVKLHRRVASETQRHSSFQATSSYVGRIEIGSVVKQSFLVSFDTSSGNLILPGWGCQSAACQEHRRYLDYNATAITADGKEMQASARIRSVVEIGFDNPTFGFGKLKGELVLDSVCVGPEDNGNKSLCSPMGIVAAKSMDDTPFRYLYQDGMLGLGLSNLAVGEKFSFLEHTLKKTLKKPIVSFAIFLTHAWGEVTFGHYKPERIASAKDSHGDVCAGKLMWAPVPQDTLHEGYWQFAIRSIIVGNKSLDVCSKLGCRGIVDSGSSTLGVSDQLYRQLLSALETDTLGGQPDANGKCGGPNIELVLADVEGNSSSRISLSSTEYSDATSNCEGTFTSVALPDSFAGAFLLGEPFLRRYYTVFEYGLRPRIGIAYAASTTATEESDATAFAISEAAALAAATSTSNAEVHKLFAKARELEDDVAGQPKLCGLSQQMFFFHCCVVQLILSAYFIHARLARICTAMYRGQKLSDAMSYAMFASALTRVTTPLENHTCSICLGTANEDVDGASENSDSFEEHKAVAPCWSQLKCGHTFHDPCIIQWLKRVDSCPVCRGQA